MRNFPPGCAPVGAEVYSSPQDFTATYLGATTLTLAGTPFVPVNSQFLLVEQYTAGGAVIRYSSASYVMTYADPTLSVPGAAFLNTDTAYRVFFSGPSRAYSAAGNDYRFNEIDPLDQHVIWETLVDTTGVAAAPTTTYYPSSVGLAMQGYSNFDAQMITSGTGGALVTTTVEVTLDTSGTPDWLDITRTGVDLMTNTAGAAAFINCSCLLHFANLNVAAVRIKSVTSVANTNAVQYNVRRTAIS